MNPAHPTEHGAEAHTAERLRVLVACEFSGVVREAFQAYNGVDAFSCDVLECEDGRWDYHIQADAIETVRDAGPWDLVIAHPPCTFLANSGVRWLYKNGERDEQRWHDMRAGAAFFANLWNACEDTPRCFENPIMHGYAQREICSLAPSVPLGKRAQIIQPWMHGHPETKGTGLYLYKLPKLKPSNVVFAEMQELTVAQRSRTHYASPGPNRWRERSRTIIGIARAMADQWVPAIRKARAPDDRRSAGGEKG